MSEVLVQDFQVGDVVKVLAETVAKDFEGNDIRLPQGIEGSALGSVEAFRLVAPGSA